MLFLMSLRDRSREIICHRIYWPMYGGCNSENTAVHASWTFCGVAASVHFGSRSQMSPRS